MAVDLMAVVPGGTNGGAKLLALDLLESLATEWDITCFCRPAAAPEIARLVGTRARILGVSNATDLAERYAEEVAHLGPFAVNFFPMQSVSLQWPETPTVSIVHDLQFADLPANFTPIELAERTAAFKSCAERSDLIITVSNFSKTRIKAIAGIESDRIKVIYNALKNEQASLGALDNLSLNRNGYFIYPANFWHHKNHARLLDAYRAYREVRADPLDLLLTGEPGLAAPEFINALKAQPGVTVSGFLNREELLELLEGAAALIFPSLYEGFGMPLVEAMAADIPIACSDVASLPEIAGQAAIMFNATDSAAMTEAMIQIAGNPALRASLVAAGRNRRLELGDFSDMRHAYDHAIRSVLGNPPEARPTLGGVDSNGWAGPDVEVGLPGPGQAEQAEIRVFVPAWVPITRLALTISSGVRRIASETVWPGQEKLINFQFLPGEHSFSIKASSSFRRSDLIDNSSELSVSYQLKEASSVAKGRRTVLWPTAAGGGSITPSDAALLVIAGKPEEGLMVTAVAVPQDPVSAILVPVVSADRVLFDWKSSPLNPSEATAPATQMALPPARLVPPFEFPAGIQTITFRAADLSPPAVITGKAARDGFSVIIPSFNQGRFISKTIDSILCQDHRLEVLVFDGGSTDGTQDVLASYGSQISWWSGKDGGQADAVNQGLAKAHGQYIAWINSDDMYARGAFAHVAGIFAKEARAGVVYGNADHVDEHGQFIEPYPSVDFDAAALLDRCFICQPAAFFRREVAVQYGGLRQSLRYCLDYEFWLRLSAAGVKFERSRKLLAHSRMYAENKTLGERLHVYFETADMMIRGMGYHEGRWIEHFANAAADHLGSECGIAHAYAIREARRLGNAIWSSRREMS